MKLPRLPEFHVVRLPDGTFICKEVYAGESTFKEPYDSYKPLNSCIDVNSLHSWIEEFVNRTRGIK